MAYRVGSVKKNLKPFKAWLHYGDSAHPPMHTVSFYGNAYDLNVLIRQAEAEGEPLRVQKESSRRTATKRKRSYSSRSRRKTTAVAARQDLREMNARVDAHHYASQISSSPKFSDSDRMEAWALAKAVDEGHDWALAKLRALRSSR